MGTDIHGVFQRYNHTTNVWEDIESNYEQGRHYQLFAVLAGVRNGTGFAGVPTGEAVTPIASPRGLPDDFVMSQEDDTAHPIAKLDYMDPRRRKWYEAGEPMVIWMGDHSFSWLTGKEMLDWFAAAPTVVHAGIVSRSIYEAWDKKSRPAAYCGGLWSNDAVIINDNEVEMAANPDWTHVRCTWDAPLGEELHYFFDEVKRLADEHGDIRFVFGFDS